ncbi:hypothetical protein R6Q59_010528 [Mikania micrantha]
MSLLLKGYYIILIKFRLCDIIGSNPEQSGQYEILSHSGFPPEKQVYLLDSALTNIYALDTGELVVDCGRNAID